MGTNCISKRINYIFKNCAPFSASSLKAKQRPTKLKGKSKSSQEWLLRQFADPYVEKAKRSSYRCRSAFKLQEIDDRYRILNAGFYVIDCGAAPGSWTQVAVERVNADEADKKLPVGNVIAIDRLPIYPIKGATVLGGLDFTEPKTLERVRDILSNNRLADVVLSDMAPNATGVRSLDQECILTLAYAAFNFAITVSKPDSASLLIKVLDGGGVPALLRDLKQYYQSVKVVKPDASRSDSSEQFLLARNFKGNAQNSSV